MRGIGREMLLWGALLAGCGDKSGADDSGSGGEEADADTDADTDADSDADSDVDTDTSALGADPDCEGYEGTPIAGATGFFVGNFAISGDKEVEGTEEWLLFANQAWKDTGNDDCKVVWNVTGSQGEATGACGACDYRLDLQAQVDTQATDCPTGLYKGLEDFTVTYNVLVDGDAATVYYESGTEVGAGQQQGGGVSYISEGACLYF